MNTHSFVWIFFACISIVPAWGASPFGESLDANAGLPELYSMVSSSHFSSEGEVKKELDRVRSQLLGDDLFVFVFEKRDDHSYLRLAGSINAAKGLKEVVLLSSHMVLKLSIDDDKKNEVRGFWVTREGKGGFNQRVKITARSSQLIHSISVNNVRYELYIL